MDVVRTRVVLVPVCHLVLPQVLVHPFEDQVLARHVPVQDAVPRHAGLGACLAAAQTGYYLVVVRHREGPDEVSQCLLSTGTGCCLAEAQQALDPAWVLALLPQALESLVLRQVSALVWLAQASQLQLVRPLLVALALWVQVWALQAWFLVQQRLVSQLSARQVSSPAILASWLLV